MLNMVSIIFFPKLCPVAVHTNRSKYEVTLSFPLQPLGEVRLQDNGIHFEVYWKSSPDETKIVDSRARTRN